LARMLLSRSVVNGDLFLIGDTTGNRELVGMV
jgi:hypothetical protein